MATIQGTAGNDSLTGTQGDDSIAGLAGSDTINALGGNDTLDGGAGIDTLNGGLGNDRYIVTAGDVLSDTGGTDTVVTDVNWSLSADFENIELVGTGNISATGNNLSNLAIGNAGNNYFNMRAGDDTIQAGAGNDWIDMSAFGTASYGNDVIDGGAGTDTVNFAISAGQQSAVTVDLTAGTISGGGVGGAGSATVTSIEHVVGAAFNDSIKGAAAAETLEGREGNDTLSGMGGNDTLVGGTGQDTFLFEVTPGAANADLVSDFVSGTDKVSLDRTVFTALGAAGNFAPGDARFASGAGFTSGRDADDRVIYNTTTGQLFYDADGNGAGASQLVATLQGVPALSASDIVVTGAGGGAAIDGTAGNDGLVGTEGDDTIRGFAGNDGLIGLGGNDTLDGGDGDDRLNGGNGNNPGEGADLLLGGNGNDTLESHSNGDVDHPEIDTLDGGLGNDTYDLRAFALDPAPNTVIVDAGGIDSVLSTHSFTLPDGIENLTVGEGTFATGNSLDNVITTFGNEDGLHRVDAREGNDTILGGTARDEMTGGAGNDVFVFSVVPEPPGVRSDEIEDFASGADHLEFENAAFTKLGAAGNFTAADARFASGAGLTSGRDVSDRLIYDTTNGDLYYDSDGNGAAQSVLVVHLTGAPTLVATDITVNRAGSTMQGTAGNDVLNGTDGNDVLNGLAGNDGLFGDRGDDTLDGGAGNDGLEGAEGNDLLVGGDGNDVLAGAFDNPNVGGINEFADTLDGGLGDDVFEVRGSETLIDAGGIDTVITKVNWTLGAGFENIVVQGAGVEIHGNELGNVISASGGTIGDDNDHTLTTGGIVDGEAGDDLLSSLSGGTATGGAGADRFLAGGGRITDFTSNSDKIVLDADVAFRDIGASGTFAPGDGRFFAAAGATGAHDADDRIIYNTTTGELFYDPDGNGAQSAQLIETLQGAPTLVATDIEVVGGAPGQTITGTPGNDSLDGTAGDDSISGLAGADRLNGLGGNDTLDGGAGIDTMVGGSGDDMFIVTAGDILFGDVSDGIDTVVTDVSWTLDGAFENLTMTGTGNISGTGHNGANFAIGNSGNNYFNMRGGDDTIQAGAGNDWIDMSAFGSGSWGVDVIDGGAGTDTVNFAISAGQQSAIFADLTAGTIRGGTLGSFGGGSVASIERVIGAGFNDSIKGAAAAETLEGREGNDTLSGMGGNDTLVGGTGSDSFVFAAAPGAGNVDLITDFVSGTDKAAFDNSVFTALGADGNFAAGDARFAAGAGFTSGHDASDRIVYNTTTGQLFYDADGSGAGAAQLVATFQGAPAIAATDITVL
jgi:Ca2+-binding RTX toxin-like protein